ncbi:sulfite exporter TauE/SafE family protein [Allopusillimonas ginsengisoli]|nr:sulfite exporter TauE/SafE family protein [Allopusillimonas ginsengisoli]
MIIESILGVVVGLIMGLTGAGGGILAVPALVLVLGTDITVAAPVTLVAVGLAAILGAVDGLRRGWVRYKAAALMSIMGAITAPLGAMIARHLPAAWLMLMFACIMIFVSFRSFQKALPRGTTAVSESSGKRCIVSPETGRFVWSRSVVVIIGAIGATSGLFTGMLGVGGGFVIVPALQKFSNVGIHSVIATSLMVIALISGATVGNALLSTQFEWPSNMTAFVVFAVVGMLAGRAASPHLSARLLQTGFATVCALVAMIVLIKVGVSI